MFVGALINYYHLSQVSGRFISSHADVYSPKEGYLGMTNYSIATFIPFFLIYYLIPY